uniref:TctD transcriptional regulator n=1 Tax=Dicranema revolutum TaxID=239144 RepID=A0A4D6WSU9_9FLOR|nr:hypothetical protein [Dicranema revolutum]
MKKQILLVDDDITLSFAISSYLLSNNFSVYVANDVVAALYEVNTNVPDLIIADIMMPYLDGYDFLEILHSNQKFCDIPVIFLTAKGMTKDRIKGYNNGCNSYLIKPFDPEELVSIINNLLKHNSLSNKFVNLKKDTRLNSVKNFIHNLSPKEISVLQLVIKGFKNKEIAQKMKMSIRNVEKYVSKLLHKTSTRNRTELAQFININGINF